LRSYDYIVLDVFTKEPFGGNPLAVFPDGGSLTTEEMQKIARELNLSESVFVMEGVRKAIKKLRIFTPQTELPMAGHPTIGAAYTLAAEGILETEEGDNSFLFEEGVGNIRVNVVKRRDKVEEVWMEQPIAEFGDDMVPRELAAQLLSLDIDDLECSLPIQTVSSGVPFLYIPVKTLAAMDRIQLRMDVWEKAFKQDPNRRHLFVFTTEVQQESANVHCRMFAPAMGIQEDPATGGASGPLGCYLVKHRVVEPREEIVIESEQGIEMGRPSRIKIVVTMQGEEIHKVAIAGTCVTMGKGTLYLP